MTDIYHITLLRHGESVGNASGIFQGQIDMPLNDTGRLQAQSLAAAWKNCRTSFDRIISSPLLRARETAEIISGQLNVGIDFDPDLMERNGGLRQGLTIEEADIQFPQPTFVHPYLPTARTGESEWEFFLRAGRAVQNLIRREPGRYLVVAHGGILNRLMYAILGIIPQPNFTGPRFRFENTAYAVLTYHPGWHNWTVLKINERSHWDGAEAEDGIYAGLEPIKPGETGDEQDSAGSKGK
jgi:broad specificity phosphatase PhoE